MATTNNISLTEMEVGQSQKETTYNNAIKKIDSILNRGVISLGDETPPVSPAAGDIYILGATPTGAWASQANKIAAYYSGSWKFVTPKTGATYFVIDVGRFYKWGGSAWATADVASLDDLSDASVSGAAQYEVLAYDGSNFVNTSSLHALNSIGVVAAGELTIDAGAVTVTGSSHTIDTESDDASDDLDSISGGTAGDLLFLTPADDARTIVFKDGTGNLLLNGDFTADHTSDQLFLRKIGSNWVEVSRSDNGA